MTIFLLFLILLLAFLSSLIVAKDRRIEVFRWPIPVALGLVFLVTASLSTLQFAFPSILTSLERNRHELVAGQLWRLVTPLFVQDGGWAGTVSNLVWLALLGVVACGLLGWRRWLVLYFGTGLVAEVLAYTVFHQGTAGNSIANFGVAAGLLLLAVRCPIRRAGALGVLGILGGLGLLALGNLHGGAFAVGLIISLVWSELDRRGLFATQRSNTPQSSPAGSAPATTSPGDSRPAAG